MPLTILPITLIFAGVLAIINVAIATRVGQARGQHQVSIGDGGNEAVIRRMRAHANFGENAPLMLGLVGLIEYNVGTSIWLAMAAALFALGRIAHSAGMDGWMPGRIFGTFTAMVLQVALGIWAISIPFVVHHNAVTTDPAVTVVPQG